jgi:hypothetical protein
VGAVRGQAEEQEGFLRRQRGGLDDSQDQKRHFASCVSY